MSEYSHETFGSSRMSTLSVASAKANPCTSETDATHAVATTRIVVALLLYFFLVHIVF